MIPFDIFSIKFAHKFNKNIVFNQNIIRIFVIGRAQSKKTVLYLYISISTMPIALLLRKNNINIKKQLTNERFIKYIS